MSSQLITAFIWTLLAVGVFIWWKKTVTARALHDAAASGNTERIGKLIASGFTVDTMYDRVSALHVAVMKNQIGAAKKLIDLGISLNKESDDDAGVTALHLAAMTGNLEMAVLLLNHKAPMEVRAANGEPPVLTAARYGHKEMVDLLVSHGADLQSTNAQGTNLLFMCIFSNDPKAASLLLDAGLNPNIQDKDKRAYAIHAAMIYAIHSGNHDMVECLLAHGADPNARDQHGMTALKMAKIDKKEHLVELLTSYGAQA